MPSWFTNPILPGKEKLVYNRFPQKTQTHSWAEWSAHPRSCIPKPTPALQTRQGLQKPPSKCTPPCQSRTLGGVQQFPGEALLSAGGWNLSADGEGVVVAAREAGAEAVQLQCFIRNLGVPPPVELPCLQSCSYVNTCSLRFLTSLMAWTGWTCSGILPPNNPGRSAPLQRNHPKLVGSFS